MKTRLENPKGLHQRYVIRKIELAPNPLFSPTAKTSQVVDNKSQYITVTAPVNKDAEYFVLRLDDMQSDPFHKEACVMAINAYADSIEPHIPKLAADIRKKYPIIKPSGQAFNFDNDPPII